MSVARWGCCVSVLVAALLTLGCQKPLFPENVPRTQYERYQTLRGKYRSAKEKNIYGGSQPALRERLAPLEQQ
jgi:hypothetical protein